MMNIYITDKESFSACASALDNRRLTIQCTVIQDAMCKVIHTNKELHDVLAENSNVGLPSLNILPNGKVNNEAVVNWVGKTPFHMLAMLQYYRVLCSERSNRTLIHNTSSRLRERILETVYSVIRNLLGLRDIMGVKTIGFKERDLYRCADLPEGVKTTEAYRQRLIALWIGDIERYAQYRQAFAKYTLDKSLPKPRLQYFPKWRIGASVDKQFYHAPEWARETLRIRQKELDDANTTPAISAA